MKIYPFVFLFLFSATLYGQQQTMPQTMPQDEMNALSAKHQYLQPLVGQWDTNTKVVGKTAAPESGTAEGKMMLGGRFLWMESTGTQLGKPYSDMKIVGYDETEKKFQAVWMDDDRTEMLQMKGVSDNGKKFTFLGSTHSPQGTATILKTVLTIRDNDHHTWEKYAIGADGKETKMLEITYTRKK